MSQHQFTKGQLLNYHEQIETMQRQGSVMVLLLHSRINDFYNQHGIRIDTLLKERFKLVAEYHETEMKDDGRGGEYESLVWDTDEKGNRKGYKLREGKSAEDFQQAFQEWNVSPVTSIITAKLVN